MTPRDYLLLEANNQQLEASPPDVAVLPWGAVDHGLVSERCRGSPSHV